MNATIYIIGIGLQLVAGLIALLQLRQTPRKLPWLLIACSSLLIVVRRVATLGQFMKAGRELAVAEVLTLAISLLFFLGVILMTRMFREVLDRQEQLRGSEKSLRAASLYARNLIEASLDPLVTISADGTITDVNTATEKITGLSREKLIGSDFSEYFTEPDMARAGYQKVFAQGHVTDYPLSVRHVSGAIADVLYNASVYRNERGEVLGVFAAARDITQHKRAETERERLEFLNRQLQKAESLGRMAGAIAHQFNNQLQVVIGGLEMGIKKLSSGADVSAQCLGYAMQAARRASQVSSGMLTYLGHTTGRLEPLDLSETCSRNLSLLLAAMPENISLKPDLPSPGPVVSANANHMQQVLANLLTNAWEAIGSGQGLICLSVKTVVPADIAASRRFPLDSPTPNRTCACLEVADTGCGIADNDIDKLFDPFFTSKFTGRGMGLPVVLGIVRAHEGFITVQSRPGSGSTFRVYLPLTEQEALPSPKAAAQVAQPSTGGTVLLVDDEEPVRNVAAMMLANLGFAVMQSHDGLNAVELFRRHRDEIRCVVCDLSMPRMDGWQTLEALRQIAPDIPVVLASGYDQAHVMSGNHAQWPQAFLGKPYELEQLREAIGRALKGKLEPEIQRHA